MESREVGEAEVVAGRVTQEGGVNNWSKMFSSRSRFRHVFGCPASRDRCYDGIRVASSSTSHDAALCAVSLRYLAIVVESTGGGVFAVLPLNKTGRVNTSTCRICGHESLINDMQWSPFDDSVLATCSDDTTIKLWTIPDGGIRNILIQCTTELVGHTKKVSHCQWHPSAADILLSSGHDFRCIVWNTRTATAARVLTLHNDVIFCSSWNHDGSLFATTSKDGQIRVIEPRSGAIKSSGRCHDGVGRMIKMVFVEGCNRLLTTGFSRTGERQYALWDADTPSVKQLKIEDLDSSSSVMVPFYDKETHIVFLAGKGDGSIRYYEVTSEPPYIRNLNQFQSPLPQRDIAVLPKRGVDPLKGELTRFYKIHATKDLCEPISMIMPSKTERFQPDIFPPTSSNQPAMTADEWLSGINRAPILVPLVDVNDNSLGRNVVKITASRRDDVTNRSRANVTYAPPPQPEPVQEAVTSQLDAKVTPVEDSSTSVGVLDMIHQFELIKSDAQSQSTRKTVTSSVSSALPTSGKYPNSSRHVPLAETRDIQNSSTDRNAPNGSAQYTPEVEQARWKQTNKTSTEEQSSTGSSATVDAETVRNKPSRHVHFVGESYDDVTNDVVWVSSSEPPDDSVVRPSLILRRQTPAVLSHLRPTVDVGGRRVVGEPRKGASGVDSTDGLSFNDVDTPTNTNRQTSPYLNGPPATTATSSGEQVRPRPPVDHRDVLDNYFKQIEEIKILKEQLSYKDKKIRRLEDQLQLLRTSGLITTSRDNVEMKT